MRTKLAILAMALVLTGCDKMGASGIVNQTFGNWAEIKLPDGCVAQQIASSSDSGVAVLCEDGRVFH